MSNQPKCNTTIRFSHIRLNLYKFEACLSFYHNIFGLNIDFRDDNNGFVELDAGTTKVALIKQENLKDVIGTSNSVVYNKKNDGIALTFQVNDLREVCKNLKTQGVKFVINDPYNLPNFGLSVIFCRDPDGNLLEIQQNLT